jgi:hypothetical protein
MTYTFFVLISKDIEWTSNKFRQLLIRKNADTILG